MRFFWEVDGQDKIDKDLLPSSVPSFHGDGLCLIRSVFAVPFSGRQAQTQAFEPEPVFLFCFSRL